MRYKLNIQRFAGEIQDPNKPIMKIKFRNSLNLTNVFDLNLAFVSNGETFTRIYLDEFHDNDMYYGSTKVYIVSDSRYTNANYQIIEIDPNQTNFNAFITAMKDNIEGVLLEAGTYKWVDAPKYNSAIMATNYEFNFNSNNNDFTLIRFNYNKEMIGAFYMLYDSNNVYDSSNAVWNNNSYKELIISENQYVNYDFYNYAITGGQLVKQETPEPTTGTVKFGTTAPTKYYLGNKAVDRIYMGTVLLYKKAVVYTITANLANCTANSDNPITIEENGGAILYYTANTGYELPDGVELTNVGSYNWDKATGKLVIARPSGNVTIKIVAKQSMSQLATPQNVSVENTTLSFDEVENATEYEVFVDNTSIGSYSKPSYKLTSDSINPENIEVNGTALTSLPYTLQSGDIIVANLMGMEDSALTVNGVKQTSNNQTFTLTNTDIAVELESGSFNGPKVTINYE